MLHWLCNPLVTWSIDQVLYWSRVPQSALSKVVSSSTSSFFLVVWSFWSFPSEMLSKRVAQLRCNCGATVVQLRCNCDTTAVHLRCICGFSRGKLEKDLHRAHSRVNRKRYQRGFWEIAFHCIALHWISFLYNMAKRWPIHRCVFLRYKLSGCLDVQRWRTDRPSFQRTHPLKQHYNIGKQVRNGITWLKNGKKT